MLRERRPMSRFSVGTTTVGGNCTSPLFDLASLYAIMRAAEFPHLQAAVSEGPQNRATAPAISLARYGASHT